LLFGLLFAATGHSDEAQLPIAETYGPNPILPAPAPQKLSTIEIAPAVGWQDGETPRVGAPDLRVQPFATGLEHPRWLYVLPNGDVLVAETNAPERKDDRKGIRGWIMGIVMKRAGAGVPSPNRITLLRDADGDGTAETQQPFITGLNSPFGMALIGRDFYVANTDAIVRFEYAPGAMELHGPGESIFDLPAGSLNHHWTKNAIASRDGTRLYVTVGSNSNVAENGMDQEARRAAILELDPNTRQLRVFANGLRNPNGLAWNPATNDLWTVVNERDDLGSDLVPDYLTSVRDGGFYGWPYSYFGQHVDARVEPPRPDMVAQAIVPEYALGPHTASLGLAFYERGALPARYNGGAFIGQHGSWNRKPLSGYKVIFVPFTNGEPSDPPEDVLLDFVDSNGDARGRPVGVAVDRSGALLVADDVGNTVWRVTGDDITNRQSRQAN
jgi:glucose/arabinose dehydrogenase